MSRGKRMSKTDRIITEEERNAILILMKEGILPEIVYRAIEGAVRSHVIDLEKGESFGDLGLAVARLSLTVAADYLHKPAQRSFERPRDEDLQAFRICCLKEAGDYIKEDTFYSVKALCKRYPQCSSGMVYNAITNGTLKARKIKPADGGKKAYSIAHSDFCEWLEKKQWKNSKSS